MSCRHSERTQESGKDWTRAAITEASTSPKRDSCGTATRRMADMPHARASAADCLRSIAAARHSASRARVSGSTYGVQAADEAADEALPTIIAG